jgi:hypothetical protein
VDGSQRGSAFWKHLALMAVGFLGTGAHRRVTSFPRDASERVSISGPPPHPLVPSIVSRH